MFTIETEKQTKEAKSNVFCFLLVNGIVVEVQFTRNNAKQRATMN